MPLYAHPCIYLIKGPVGYKDLHSNRMNPYCKPRF